MRRVAWTPIVLILTALTVGLLLAACGDDDSGGIAAGGQARADVGRASADPAAGTAGGFWLDAEEELIRSVSGVADF